MSDDRAAMGPGNIIDVGSPEDFPPQPAVGPDLEDGLTVETRMGMAQAFVTACIEGGVSIDDDDYDELAMQAVKLTDAVLERSGWYRLRRVGIALKRDQEQKAATGLVVPGPGGRRRH